MTTGATKNTKPDPPDPFKHRAGEGGQCWWGAMSPPATPPYLRHNFSNHPAAKPTLTPNSGFIVAVLQLALEEVYL